MHYDDKKSVPVKDRDKPEPERPNSSNQKLGQQKQAYSVLEFCQVYGICRSKVYEEIKAGRLKAVKVGRRTLILPEAVKEWRDSLPRISSPPLQPAFAGLMAA